MNKAMLRYLLTLAMGLLGIVLLVSSLLLWVVFPSGFFPARLLWIAIHKWVGLALTVLVIAHVLGHWRWLWRMTGLLLASRGRAPSSPPDKDAEAPRPPRNRPHT
jgi:hypothetical protein